MRRRDVLNRAMDIMIYDAEVEEEEEKEESTSCRSNSLPCNAGLASNAEPFRIIRLLAPKKLCDTSSIMFTGIVEVIGSKSLLFSS